ncbi:hypothetical protein ODQ38_22025, partial [Escherichia coli]|nr:hypothetical protein [Escherichia coli]MCV7984921.1 hypothetical protein [Escherichia coli]MCV8160769.1 hypothetical protein [Escherichia coli]MCV8219312.1 hypothetical protein [Escherichia coli]
METPRPAWSQAILSLTPLLLSASISWIFLISAPGCQRQDYWPFFAIFNVRYWSLMLSAFRHFIITDWR